MKRSQAIEIVASSQLQSLTPDERSEQLETMLLEDWTELNKWKKLPSNIQQEFGSGKLLKDASDSEYDCVLIIWLKDNLKAVKNDYLFKEINKISNYENPIEGIPEPLVACPCCGYCTLNEPSSYDICSVCWWEDDGQNNTNADISMGGPNYGISLAQARYNFITHDIYDPKRADLIKEKKTKEMFEKGREFILKNDTIIDTKTNESWKIKLDEHITN